MVTDFSVCARMKDDANWPEAHYVKRLTSASLLFLKGISSAMPLKKRSLFFLPLLLQFK